MQNKLVDLNNHLFAQLERLGDEEIKGENLTEEIKGENLTEEINRAKAITDTAGQIIANGSLILKARIAAGNCIDANITIPKMLEE